MNYRQQLEVVKGLFIPPSTEMRIDCPFCTNKNTFLINTLNNGLSWYCFHASCKAKGKYQGDKNMEYVQDTFKKNVDKTSTTFIVPDSFKVVTTNEKAQRYLHKNNCWESWAWLRADIKYDVRQDRVVFLIKDKTTGRYTGAVGRGLNKNVYPKWFMYGGKEVPFKCGECEDAVIVEDCASACAVSNILTGISIMGTSLMEEHKKYLEPYKNLYIALDRDATAKSYEIAKELRSEGFKNIIVKPLTDDLKYYNTDEIKEMFYGR